ncbi:MAG: hypothetical protein HY769_06805 [Candidatus Stahlbacteria bacterium]|nr:hypothetical protein [Candidatus Stahlbacteria bacterium]
MKYIILFIFISLPVESRWSRTGDVNTKRSGSENAMLTDGRMMAISGMEFDASGYYAGQGVNSYEIFSPATGMWVQGTMPARGDHTLGTLLPNGNVLFVNAGDGSIWIYDPHTNNWVSGGTFGTWQSRTCGTLLKDGKLLLTNYNNSTACVLYDWSDGSITPTGATNLDHSGSQYAGGGAVETLLPDGTVLIAGGNNPTDCEVYDPSSGGWSITGDLNTGRSAYAGIYLRPPWNKVLIAGGASGGIVGEIWDGAIWANTGNLNFGTRATPSIVLIPNGKALIMGGDNNVLPLTAVKTCELYDPDVNTWARTDSFHEVPRGRSHLSAAVLYTGRVLAYSGHDYAYSGATAVVYEVTRTSEIYDPSQGVVDTRTPLLIPRALHTATPLPIIHTQICSTNILITGGKNLNGVIKSCELYNYDLNLVAFTGDLNIARSQHTATLLASGKVLVVGGKSWTGETKSCELYDANIESWTVTGNLNTARAEHTATLLTNGKVLVTGGKNATTYFNNCEEYTPSSGIWNYINSMSIPRAFHSAVLLLNGRIMVIGGETTGGTITNSCEIWSGTIWSATTSLSTARSLHTAVLLQSGKVLVIGGRGNGGNALASCELYDPVTGMWTAETPLNYARYAHNAVLLYSGLVLVTGGNNGSGNVSNWEVYDPATHKWKAEGMPSVARDYHTSTLIGSDKPYIIMIGGQNNTGGYLNSIERYDVGLGYRPIWQSMITNYPRVTHVSAAMNIQGTLFREYSEADGGNHCHIANTDHPIISLVRVGGGNWQGNGGGEIMYMPLSHYWDETHTNIDLPDTAAGYYRLWSIVNGIPCKWYEGCTGINENEYNELNEPNEIRVYPNPATAAGVYFQLKSEIIKDITIIIYDLSGRVIKNLSPSSRPVPCRDGSVCVKWDGKETQEKRVSPGIYFYRVISNNSLLPVAVGKIVILY